MIISVGSANAAKVNAVKELIGEYSILAKATVNSLAADSNVSAQPLSLDETITGAKNRAKAAFKDCTYSIGIESGLFPVPHTKTGYLDVCAAVVYDGKEFHVGLSSAFEYPPAIMKLVLEEGMEVNDAQFKLGMTKDPKVGSAQGVVGLLTNGRVDRKAYTKEALRMAFIHLEHSELYPTKH